MFFSDSSLLVWLQVHSSSSRCNTYISSICMYVLTYTRLRAARHTTSTTITLGLSGGLENVVVDKMLEGRG